MKTDSATETPAHNLPDATAAGQLITKLAQLSALLGVTVANRDREVLAAQQKHAKTIEQISKDISEGEARLKAWAEENRDKEFGEEQSREFMGGWLRFRQGQRSLALRSGWDWDKVLKALHDFPVTHFWRKYIRTKPEVNKQLLLAHTKDTGDGAALPAAKLVDIGLKITREERFEVEYRPEIVKPDVPCP